MWWFGVLVIGAAVVGAIRSFTKAGEYDQAEREYQRRRRELRQKVNDGR